MSKFNPTYGDWIRSTNLRYWSNFSIIRPGSGSMSRPTSYFWRLRTAGHQLVVEGLRRHSPKIARLQRSARFGLQVLRADFSSQLQGPLRVFAANGPVVGVRFDPRRVPIRLPRVVHGVHHEAVDVGNAQTVFHERVANRFTSFRQQIDRPGVRYVGQDLQAE